MENQTVTTVEEIIEESISLSSAKEAYELPTDYKASWELEKGIREALEREVEKLREENRKVKELTFQRDKAWDDENRAKELTDMYKKQAEELRETIGDLRNKINLLTRQRNEDAAFYENELKSYRKEQIEASKSISNLHSRSTTLLNLSISLAAAAVGELVMIVLLLNR